MFDAQRERWLATVEALEPTVHRKRFATASRAAPSRDPGCFQGWRMEPAGGEARGVDLSAGPVFLDFGRHLVGRLRLRLTGDAGATARLGEMPAEVCEDPDAAPGTLGGEWLEPEPLRPDAEGWATAPGRRAFRYVKLWADAASGSAVLRDAEVVAETTASWDDPPPAGEADAWRRDLDRVALHTLRNCMHAVYEDGPKRDRRLWVGDLYLQAQAAYETFGGADLVKRCLYLFAATTGEDGVVSPCVFSRPTWHGGNHIKLPSYAWLFAATLRDYLRATGDRQTAAELWPVARHQLALFDRHADAGGVFSPPEGEVWRFVDWHPDLDPQPAEQATAIYSVACLIEMGEALGYGDAVAALRRRREAMVASARERFLDPATGLFISPETGQASWATQSWMIRCGVADNPVALARATLERDDVVQPVTPYMEHNVVTALFDAGLAADAWCRVERLWGGMLGHGATTFWEAYDPADDLLSPYKSHLHNSYCHAWSCTPCLFVRRGLAGDAAPDAAPAEAASVVSP